MASMQDAAFFCIPEEKMPIDKRHVYCGVCIASAVLGLGGAVWQIRQWRPLLQGYKYRRKPSPNPMVVFSLALADMLACIGVVVRAIALLSTSPPVLDKDTGDWVPFGAKARWVTLGTFIEGLCQYFYGVTFMWTTLYAIDIYLQISHREPKYTWYHISGWVFPIATTLGSILAVTLGNNLPDRCPEDLALGLRYLFYYIPVLLVIVANPVLFVWTSKAIKQRMRESGLVSSHHRAVMGALQSKFLAMVLLFTLCWLPNLVDSVLHIVLTAGDVPPAQAAKFFPIWVLEAVLNPLQGLFNCIVYGRHMLFRRMARSNAALYSSDRIQESTPILYRSEQDPH